MIPKIGKARGNAFSLRAGTERTLVAVVEDGHTVDAERVEGDWVAITFQFEKLGAGGKPLLMTEFYKNILIGTGKLPRVLTTILGRELTEDEKDGGVPVELIIEHPCRLEIEDDGRDKQGNRKVHIKKVLPATPEQIEKFDREHAAVPGAAGDIGITVEKTAPVPEPVSAEVQPAAA